jgi:hypothetical protein
VEDPNLRVRLIASGRVLATDPADARAVAVVAEALAAPAPRPRSAALALIETLDNPGVRFLPALRERAATESDAAPREQLQRLLAAGRRRNGRPDPWPGIARCNRDEIAPVRRFHWPLACRAGR